MLIDAPNLNNNPLPDWTLNTTFSVGPSTILFLE